MTIQALKALLYNPDFDNQFMTLSNLIEPQEVYAGLTFWGERVIKVRGEEGSVSLNVLTDKVVSAIYTRCLPSNPRPFNDRGSAEIVVTLLASCYRRTDKLIAQANCFTRILAGLRNLSFWAMRAHADIEYLNMYPGFKKGYVIIRWPWYRGPSDW
jgi:hypothetical protein